MFVLFDSETNRYIDNSGSRWNEYASVHAARKYKRLSAAITAASLANVPRNIPPGRTGPDKHYQNRPQMQVHEIDQFGLTQKIHSAPPQYICL